MLIGCWCTLVIRERKSKFSTMLFDAIYKASTKSTSTEAFENAAADGYVGELRSMPFMHECHVVAELYVIQVSEKGAS